MFPQLFFFVLSLLSANGRPPSRTPSVSVQWFLTQVRQGRIDEVQRGLRLDLTLHKRVEEHLAKLNTDAVSLLLRQWHDQTQVI